MIETSLYENPACTVGYYLEDGRIGRKAGIKWEKWDLGDSSIPTNSKFMESNR